MVFSGKPVVSSGHSVDKPTEIGDHACYPSCWEYLCVVPKEAALAWLLQAVPYVRLGLGMAAIDIVNAEAQYHNTCIRGWLNKLYVVVANDGIHATALYSHDGVYWVLRKKLD